MSPGSAKPIRFTNHARSRLSRRGCTVAEVEATIRTSAWRPALGSRLEASKTFAYRDVWNGTFYANKRVRPVFDESATEIVVITVYTYFF